MGSVGERIVESMSPAVEWLSLEKETKSIDMQCRVWISVS